MWANYIIYDIPDTKFRSGIILEVKQTGTLGDSSLCLVSQGASKYRSSLIHI